MIRSLSDINSEFEKNWFVQPETDNMPLAAAVQQESDTSVPDFKVRREPDTPVLDFTALQKPDTSFRNMTAGAPPTPISYNNAAIPEKKKAPQSPGPVMPVLYAPESNPEKRAALQAGPFLPELNFEDALEAHRSLSTSAKTLSGRLTANGVKGRNTVSSLEASAGKARKSRKKAIKSPASYISDILFYAALVLVLLITFSFTAKFKGGPVILFGHSIMSVLTPSMQDVLPKGSLILVKQVDPDTLNVGDDITYMKNDNTSITHRIAAIFENYEDLGIRGFQTKGVNNNSPDAEIVYAQNVVGLVIFHIPVMGAFLTYLGAHLHTVIIIFALLMILSFSIKGLFAKSSGAPGKTAKEGAGRSSGKRRKSSSTRRVTVYNGSGLSLVYPPTHKSG